MDFKYITFVNNNQTYLDLLKVLLESIRKFSRYHIIVYFLSVPDDVIWSVVSPYEDIVIVRKLSQETLNLTSIYYYKPYAIIDSIAKGLTHGFYIDTDNIITPQCDQGVLSSLQTLSDVTPISPIHPDDVRVPYYYMENLGVERKTQHYVHASCLLYKSSHLPFLQTWYNYCLKSKYCFWDETCLNCVYWKYNCQNHHLPIIDPYFDQFYSSKDKNKGCWLFHGCKNPQEQRKLLVDIGSH